jgi:hypothetical protein
VNQNCKTAILRVLDDRKPRLVIDIALTGISISAVQISLNFLVSSGEVRKGYVNPDGEWCRDGDVIFNTGYSLP